jgi:hypothetical protein
MISVTYEVHFTPDSNDFRPTTRLYQTICYRPEVNCFLRCLASRQEVGVQPFARSRYQPDGDNGEACCKTRYPPFSIPQPRGWATLARHNSGTLQNLCRFLCRTVPQFIVPDPYKLSTGFAIFASPSSSVHCGPPSRSRVSYPHAIPCRCGSSTW